MKIAILNDTHCGIRNSSEIFLKNSEEWKCNKDFTISDVEQLLEEINNVISKVNERFTY